MLTSRARSKSLLMRDLSVCHQPSAYAAVSSCERDNEAPILAGGIKVCGLLRRVPKEVRDVRREDPRAVPWPTDVPKARSIIKIGYFTTPPDPVS